MPSTRTEKTAPHPILDIDQTNVGYWSDILTQKDKEKHDLQVSLWAVSGVAVALLVAVVALSFGRKEFHYRDVTDALGNSWQFGIRSVDAHDQEAIRLRLERYIKGIRLVTRDAVLQQETNIAYHMSRTKAQHFIDEYFAREGKPDDLNARDLSRSVIEGTVQVAIQTGNSFTARWQEQTREPTHNRTPQQFAGSGVLELKDPSKLTSTERQVSRDGVFVSEFSYSEMK